MSAGEEEGKLVYSIFCLNLMTTTDKTKETVPIAKKAAWGSQSAVVNPPAAHCAKPDKLCPHPPMNRAQAVTDARALNISGIFSLLKVLNDPLLPVL
jgi:hypothetical protein